MASNFSLYSIPAAYTIAVALPHFYAIGLVETAGGGLRWDNANPRNFLAKIQDKLPKERFEMIQRARAAELNGLENISFFAASVIAGNMARLPVENLHWHTGGYLISRALYNVFYIFIRNNKLSALRSISWFTSMGFIFALFIKSGMELNGGKLW